MSFDIQYLSIAKQNSGPKGVSREPFFGQETAEGDARHYYVIAGRPIRATGFAFCQDVSNCWELRYWKFGDDKPSSLGDIVRKRVGQKIAPPPRKARVNKQDSCSVQVSQWVY